MRAKESYGPPRSEEDERRLADAVADSFNLPVENVRSRWEHAGRESRRVVRREGTVVGGLLALPMGHFFGRRSVPATGIAAVAVAPEARGRGVAREMMAAVLRESRAEARPLSSLYASTFALYRSVGYERAGWLLRARVRPSDLPRERPRLRVRRATDDDRPLLAELARERARHADGLADRGPYVWERVLAPLTLRARTYVLEGAEPEGHVTLHAPESGFDRLWLADWSARTPDALQSVLAFVAEHGTIWKELEWQPAVGDPLLHSLPERSVTLDVRETWMLRLADVPAALAARGYARGLRAELHLDVADDLVPENAGRWTVRVGDGRAEVSSGGEGRLRLDVGTLASLYTGFVRAEDLALAGRAEGPAEALETASGVFAGQGPSMLDFF